MLRREFWQGLLGVIGFGSIGSKDLKKYLLSVAQDYDDIINRDLVIIGKLKEELKRKDDCIIKVLLLFDKHDVQQHCSCSICKSIRILCEALDGVKSNES